MRLHVERHDDGEGPYLLLVHGFLSSRAQWRVNLEGLKRFCRPVVIELWGHGRSPVPDDPAAYEVDNYAQMFEEIRAELGAERWFVCGQSFGAGLTMNYALRHPDRVIGQVFTNSLSALSPADALGTREEHWARADALEAGGIAAIEALPFHPRFATRFPGAITQEMLDDAARASPSGVANGVRITLPRLSMLDRLPGTKVPTLLVQGLWEKRFQPLAATGMAALPVMKLVALEGGHSINIEAAEAFNAAVADFVAGCV
jgi:2-succinyl-6-hydroxy-2,4-cyclohexadiene-1-carboxylate synthase